MISSDIPISMEIPASVRISQYARICTTVSTHSAAFIHWKPCCRPAALSTIPMVEMPTVISQNDQLPSLKDHSSRPHMRGQTKINPPIAHTTKVPKTVRCEWEITKSVKWVGCWIERNASSEP